MSLTKWREKLSTRWTWHVAPWMLRWINMSPLSISIGLISGELGFFFSLPGKRKSFLICHLKLLGDQFGLLCPVSVNFSSLTLNLTQI